MHESMEFIKKDLRGARFVGSDLTNVVMRGVEIPGADIDSPWLMDADRFLVNGVNVIPFVDAELDRRFPGRAERRAADPEGLRAAWAKVEHTWARTLERAEAMPAGTVDVSVDGEWSFAQTLRHLVYATDMWLGRPILRLEEHFHPIGYVHVSGEGDDELAGNVLHMRHRKVVLLRICQLDVSDAARRLLHLARYSFITLAAESDWPLHFLPASWATSVSGPLRARGVEVVREDEGRAAAVGAMNNKDVTRRELY